MEPGKSLFLGRGYPLHMDKLPHFDRAVIPQAKLRYCLDDSHPTGAHKARVFRSALGITSAHAYVLERMLRDGISVHGATRKFTLIDGTERWVVQWTVIGRLGPLTLISAWDYDRRERRPHLLSCYLRKVKSG